MASAAFATPGGTKIEDDAPDATVDADVAISFDTADRREIYMVTGRWELELFVAGELPQKRNAGGASLGYPPSRLVEKGRLNWHIGRKFRVFAGDMEGSLSIGMVHLQPALDHLWPAIDFLWPAKDWRYR